MANKDNIRKTYNSIEDLYSSVTLQNNEFRLLFVESVSGDDVVCYLNKHKVPYEGEAKYCAISYTWGSQLLDHSVKCCGININVTKSCFDVLSTLGNVLVWIDQLCIDQANLAERTEQIMLMNKIYSGAQLVFIWLDKFENLTCGIARDRCNEYGQTTTSYGDIDASGAVLVDVADNEDQEVGSSEENNNIINKHKVNVAKALSFKIRSRVLNFKPLKFSTTNLMVRSTAFTPNNLFQWFTVCFPFRG